ncbi:MAG: hypothetical protein SZ59_C0001G0039 [candidate division TM6 bacterium GW2011_GWF2_28_16]|nr:MAG: hypothetical protein SZ59_C0001G0039 [candidate division TM6 bacterium GW2011_GWF2_28_16]
MKNLNKVILAALLAVGVSSFGLNAGMKKKLDNHRKKLVRTESGVGCKNKRYYNIVTGEFLDKNTAKEQRTEALDKINDLFDAVKVQINENEIDNATENLIYDAMLAVENESINGLFNGIDTAEDIVNKVIEKIKCIKRQDVILLSGNGVNFDEILKDYLKVFEKIKNALLVAVKTVKGQVVRIGNLSFDAAKKLMDHLDFKKIRYTIEGGFIVVNLSFITLTELSNLPEHKLDPVISMGLIMANLGIIGAEISPANRI